MDALFVPLKLIICLLVAYPLGSLFIRIPSSQPVLKHVFNIAITMLFFFPVLHLYSAFAQLLASVLATFYITKYYHAPAMPWVVFAVVMGHLTVNHIIRSTFRFSYETLDVRGPQMVLVMKLTTFAWNVHDGRRRAEDLDKWRRAKRVTQFPSLLEFLGYSFYFPGILVGPYLDFVDYMDLINETLLKKLAAKSKHGRNVPSGRKRVAYRKMLFGLAYLGIFVVFAPTWNYRIALSPWFVEQSMLTRVAVYQFCGVIERMKYYAVWTLTEGASILTGLGFTGMSPSGETTWNGAANVDPLNVELAPNFNVLLDSWNMKTNVWLRECVYKRVTPKGKKPGFGSSMITFGTSAFWYGIVGGYYLTFVTGGFITTISLLARANIRPLVLPAPGASPSIAKHVYNMLGTLITILLLNFAASPFMLLDVNDSILAWARLGFYGHIIIGGSLAFFYAFKQASKMVSLEATTIANLTLSLRIVVEELLQATTHDPESQKAVHEVLVKENEALRTLVEELKRTVRDLQSASSDVEMQRIQYEDLVRENERLSECVWEMRESTTQLQWSGGDSELQTLINEDLARENARLRTEAREMQDNVAQLATSGHEEQRRFNAELAEENERRLGMIQALQTNLEAQRTEVEQLAREVDRLKTQLRAASARAAPVRGDTTDLPPPAYNELDTTAALHLSGM
ncbi:MBOAT, membrane-bound O-acyltransferase family-domain-containing protein [Mycena sanguinolenta]|nr:MBOAT, membrane-bound O-acyltransferase family-domain-containing protein [Mycena sanguinolenta]